VPINKFSLSSRETFAKTRSDIPVQGFRGVEARIAGGRGGEKEEKSKREKEEKGKEKRRSTRFVTEVGLLLQ
jgi:hypothetical protein